MQTGLTAKIIIYSKEGVDGLAHPIPCGAGAPVFTVGRTGPTTSLVVPQPHISAQQCAIFPPVPDKPQWRLIDTSTNGTSINGVAVGSRDQAQRLLDAAVGDVALQVIRTPPRGTPLAGLPSARYRVPRTITLSKPYPEFTFTGGANLEITAEPTGPDDVAAAIVQSVLKDGDVLRIEAPRGFVIRADGIGNYCNEFEYPDPDAGPAPATHPCTTEHG